MRTTTRNTLVDIKVGSRKATPVLLQGIHEHPVRRNPMHVDFQVVSMTEAITVDVPVNYMGDSTAADKLGGTLLHMRESVSISALATALPSAIDLDIIAARLVRSRAPRQRPDRARGRDHPDRPR